MEADIIQRSNECRIPEMKTAKYFDVIKTHVSSWECPPIHYSRTCVPVFIHSTHECLGVKCPYSQICVTAYGSHGNNVLPIFFAWCTFSKYAYAICPFKWPGKLVQTMLQPYLIASQFNQILQHEANPWRQFLVGRVQLNARKVLIHPGLQKTHKTEFLFRHGNWKKCLGSTEPKQLGQGPPRPWWGAGAMPCWRVQGGTAPPPLLPAENKFWHFGDQFVASQSTEIYILYPLKHQNQHFITSLSYQPIFKTTNIYNQAAKVTKFTDFLWNT